MSTNTCLQTDKLYFRLGGEQRLRLFMTRLYQYMAQLPEVKPVRDMHAMPLSEAGERLFKLYQWLAGRPKPVSPVLWRTVFTSSPHAYNHW